MGRIAFTLFGILILTSLLTTHHSCEAEAVGEATIEIEMITRTAKAELEPDQHGVVSLKAKATADVIWSPSIQYIIVEIDARAGDWIVSKPPPLVFSKSIKEQKFIVTVQVPAGTLASEERVLSVGGSWRYSPGNQGGECIGDTATIYVEQYHHIVTTNNVHEVEANPGDSIDLEIFLNNRGNGLDTAYLGISNGEMVSKNNLDIEYSTEDLSLPVHTNNSIMATVSLPEEISNGEYELLFRPGSRIAEDQGKYIKTDETKVTIVVEEEPIIEVPTGSILTISIPAVVIGSIVLLAFLLIRKRTKRRYG